MHTMPCPSRTAKRFGEGPVGFLPRSHRILRGHAFLLAESGYHKLMIRISSSLPVTLVLGSMVLTAAAPAFAQSASAPAKPKTAATQAASPASSAAAASAKGKPAAASAKADPKAKPAPTKTAKAETGEAPKPALVGTFGDWGAYLAPGKARTCYALGQPKDRNPKELKRDPAYVFISTRPGENVRNEVSIAMGFDVKAAPEPKAEIGASSFALVAKGANLWVKNAAEEAPMLEAMRKTGKLVVRAASMKGNVTVDSYSLAGLSQALDRVKKDCP